MISDDLRGHRSLSDSHLTFDIRAAILTQDLDLLPDVPVAPEVVAVEGAQGTDRLVDRAAMEIPFGLEVDEEIQNLRLAESREVELGIMIGQLHDPPQVGVLGLLTQSFELDKARVLLIPAMRGETLRCVFVFFAYDSPLKSSPHLATTQSEPPRSGSVQQVEAPDAE